jgi:hypothetical protein
VLVSDADLIDQQAAQPAVVATEHPDAEPEVEPAVAIQPAAVTSPTVEPIATAPAQPHPPISIPLRMPPPAPAETRPWEPLPEPTPRPAQVPVVPAAPGQWHIVAPEVAPPAGWVPPVPQATWRGTPVGEAFAPPPVAQPQGRGIWEASSKDVIGRPGSGVRPCGGCALPLSASARFCRRCGQRQA